MKFAIYCIAILIITTSFSCTSIIGKPASMIVESDPPGADVRVYDSNDEEIAHGITPLTLVFHPKKMARWNTESMYLKDGKSPYIRISKEGYTGDVFHYGLSQSFWLALNDSIWYAFSLPFLFDLSLKPAVNTYSVFPSRIQCRLGKKVIDIRSESELEK